MNEQVGVASVVREAVVAAADGVAAMADGDQLDLGLLADGDQLDLALLPIPTRLEGPMADLLGVVINKHHRGPGRPAGSENRATRELREYLLARGVHPLVAMMRWSLHTPLTLAQELGCSKLEAYDRLKVLWVELAPYFASKLAPTNDRGESVPFFQMLIGGQQVAVNGVAVPPWLLDAEVRQNLEHEQNQGLSAVEAGKSHAESHTPQPSDGNHSDIPIKTGYQE